MLEPLPHLLCPDSFHQPGIDCRTRRRLQDVPGLRFAAVIGRGERIGRMYLDRQILVGVDQLHQEWETGAAQSAGSRPEQPFRIARDQVSDRLTRKLALRHNRIVAGQDRLADRWLTAEVDPEVCQPQPTPRLGIQPRLDQQGVGTRVDPHTGLIM